MAAVIAHRLDAEASTTTLSDSGLPPDGTSLLEDFAPAPTPYGTISLPNVTQVAVNESGTVRFAVSTQDAGTVASTVVLRALFSDGSHRDIKTLGGGASEVTLSTADIQASGVPFAIGSARWQLVRQVSTDSFAQGEIVAGTALEFAGNTVKIQPKADMAAALTRTGIQFIRQNKEVGAVELAHTTGQNHLDGSYLTGTKFQPIAYSGDLGSVYVAGNGVLYQIDNINFELINTIAVPAGGNITSLATVGDLLFIGEGGGASSPRLLVMSTNPGSARFNQFVSLRGTGIESSPLGVSGMAIGADGRTLVLGLPNQRDGFGGAVGVAGDVLVLDLGTLDGRTGAIAAPIRAALPTGGLRGKSPAQVTATRDADRFLLTFPKDINHGLATLTITRDADHHPVSAVLKSIDMSQPTNQIRIDRLNIQRAQSAVYVERDGVEYAIVSDDNHSFEDPFWKAMFEAPSFLFTPGGAPIAVGGSASAKKVAVGGKLGVIRDPFGRQGGPEFLGASLPVDGHMFRNLSLSQDGKVLLGQLYGAFSSNPSSENYLKSFPHQTHLWNVDALITAAVNRPDEQRMREHFRLPSEAEQIVPVAFTGPVAGTVFDPAPLKPQVVGRMGDVITVNVAEQVARQLVVYALAGSGTSKVLAQQKHAPTAPGYISEDDLNKPWQQLNPTQQQVVLDKMRELGLDDTSGGSRFFAAGPLRLDQQFEDVIKNPNRELTLLTDPANGKVLSRSVKMAVGTEQSVQAGAKAFEKTGVLFFAPHLTTKDMNGLRLGDRVGEKNATVNVKVRINNPNPGTPDVWIDVSVAVKAEDFEHKTGRVFFGDRSLENPGYSEIRLHSNIGLNKTGAGWNDALDVWSVEQRLKYLGFPSRGGNTDFVEDGAFGDLENRALLLFEKVVNYDASDAKSREFGSYDDQKLLSQFTLSASGNDIKWLNAYNTPHWMQFTFGDTGRLTGWEDKTASPADSMGTSWLYDLMKASQESAVKQGRGKLLFTGGGSLGMVLNLGINENYISLNNQAHIDKAEWLLGLSDVNSMDLKDVVADNSAGADPLAKLKFVLQEKERLTALGGGQWNYAVAQELSALLANINRVPDASVPTNNSQGANNQTEALKDLLAVFSATRNDGSDNNGSREEQQIRIKSGGADDAQRETIYKALFGDGTQSGSILDAANLFVGGTGSEKGGIGAKLTTETLAALMGNSKANVADWVDPLNEAMAKFDINTPERLAAFLANVRAETLGLSPDWLVEHVGWSDPTLHKVGNFTALDLSKPTDKAIYDGYLAGTSGVGATRGQKQSNYAYANRDLNGDEASEDGYTYRGRGVLQITRKGGYGRVTDGGTRGSAVGGETILGLNQIYGTTYDFITNPDLLETDKTIAARSGAWYWRYGSSPFFGNLNAVVDRTGFTDEENFKIAAKGVKGSVDSSRVILWETVKGVVYDQNGYGNMAEVLKTLGISSKREKDYNTKFGVALGQRTLQEIEPSGRQSLLADVPQVSGMPEQAQQALLAQLQAEFGIEPEEMDMVFLEMPNLPPEQSTVLVASQAERPRAVSDELYGTICVCFLSPAAERIEKIENKNEGAGFLISLSPRAMADNIFSDGARGSTEYLDYERAEVTLLEAPKHGRVTNDFSLHREIYYYPDKGYAGNDKAVFLVNIEGRKIKVVFLIKIGEKYDYNIGQDNKYHKYCPDPEGWWKGSQLDAPHTGHSVAEVGGVNAGADLAVSFGNLTGGALGEATHTSITLDASAAGYGWYIDPSPSDSSEFLATADPTLFKARAGSEAAGKMDLLSVLLHEYGHVLGLAHSGDAVDFMAPTLQPGERRLPTAAELQTMANLVAELQRAPDPAPGAPAPAPFIAGFGLLAAIRPRRGEFGDTSSYENVELSIPQFRQNAFETALNTTLVDGELYSPEQWLRSGNVSVAAGTATLGESGAAHAQLAQQFVIGEGDRYLAFTVADPNLRGNGNGPSDAFEVALLDANTGAALLGSDGLSRSDALLNIQRNASGALVEHAASAVHQQRNADGSTTYVLDLRNGVPSGALAGAPALLSFDLIGFGGHDSQVSLRDVRLLADPLAFDDAVVTDEDTALTLAVLANDLPGSAAVPAIEIVEDPAHGALSINADGTLGYVPAADYNGDDRFRYRYTVMEPGADGELHAVHSNIATVSLSIRPVNDAPSAPGVRSGTIMAGQPLRIDPLHGATDVEGDALSAVLDTPPAHGTLTVNADGSWTYVAEIEYAGADAFSFRIGDGTDRSAPVTFRVTVLPANTAPEARSARLQLHEDGRLRIDLAAFGSDAENDTLSGRITLQPSHGSLSLNDDGSFTYTPEPDFNGSDALRFILSDGRLESLEAVLTLDIAAVNDAPQLQDQSAELLEDGSLVLLPLLTAVDVDGDALTALVVNGPAHGAVSLNADGTFTYRPDADYSGPDRFSYVVNDGELDSNIATVSLTIAAIADAPELQRIDVVDEQRQLFHTGWEDAANGDNQSTLVPGPLFDGWTLLTQDHAIGPVGAHGHHDDRHHDDRTVGNLSKPSRAARVQGARSAGTAVYVRVHEDSEHRATPQSGRAAGFERFPVDGRARSGQDGFEIWSSGDRMAGPHRSAFTASAAEGQNVLELNNAAGHQYQTLGIERSVQTQAGVYYTLSLQAAGRLGYGAETTGFSVYVDGVKLATLQPVSDGTQLDWQRYAFRFTGTGAMQSIRIVADAEHFDPAGRGALIDDIALHAQVLRDQGQEGQAIELSQFHADLSDRDGSETLSVRLGGLPAGSALSDGAHATSADAQGEADVTGWDLSRLSLTPPPGFSGTLSLTLTATATEAQANAAVQRASVSQQITVQVEAVATPPSLQLAAPNAAVSREVFYRPWQALSNHHAEGGAEHTFRTVAGADYTLSFDYGAEAGEGRPGEGRLDIWIDNVLAGSFTANGSERQSVVLPFVGSGGVQHLRIELSGTNKLTPASIDHLQLVETLPQSAERVYGFAGSAIRLPSIAANLVDTDGSEALAVELLGLPTGATLSDGQRSVVIGRDVPGHHALNLGALDLAGWQLDQLHLIPPPRFVGELSLQVRAGARGIRGGRGPGRAQGRRGD